MLCQDPSAGQGLTKVRFPAFWQRKEQSGGLETFKTSIWKDGGGYPESQRRMSMPGGSKDFDCLRQSMSYEVMFKQTLKDPDVDRHGICGIAGLCCTTTL